MDVYLANHPRIVSEGEGHYRVKGRAGDVLVQLQPDGRFCVFRDVAEPDREPFDKLEDAIVAALEMTR